MSETAIIYLGSGMRRDIENNCSTCTACKSSGKNSKHHSPLSEKLKLLVLTALGQEMQFDFSGKLLKKHVSSKPYIPFGIDQHSK